MCTYIFDCGVGIEVTSVLGRCVAGGIERRLCLAWGCITRRTTHFKIRWVHPSLNQIGASGVRGKNNNNDNVRRDSSDVAVEGAPACILVLLVVTMFTEIHGVTTDFVVREGE